MQSENTELQNKIKYSIWQTRTDGTKENSAESTERPILESKQQTIKIN